MHVVVATTGVLSPEPTVEFVRHLIGLDGRVTVITVIEVPHDFLEHLDDDSWRPFAVDDTDQARHRDVELSARYVEERGRKLSEPLVSALLGAGIEADRVFIEGADPAAAISSAAEDLDADVVVLGATRPIFDEQAWASVSARVMAQAGRPVLVVPPQRRVEEPTPDPARRPVSGVGSTP